MTYLESITYLTGNFLQVSQFAIKNAYRVITLTESKEKETPYMAGASSLAEAAEALAKAYLTMNKSLSGEELVQFFSLHKGLSSKDFKDLKLIHAYKRLLKRERHWPVNSTFLFPKPAIDFTVSSSQRFSKARNWIIM